MAEIGYRKVDIRPIDRLKEAGGLMGDQYWLFVGIVLVGAIIGGLVPVILLGPMMCGIFKCYLDRAYGRQTNFESLFKGFDYFLESLIVSVVLTVAVAVVILPLGCLFGGLLAVLGGNGEGSAAVVVMMLLLMFVIFFVFILVMMVMNLVFHFAFLLIVDQGAKAMPAIKASFGATMANIGGLFGFAIAATALCLLAMLCCYFPVYLALPYVLGATTLIYRDIFSVKPASPFGASANYPPGSPTPPPIQ